MGRGRGRGRQRLMRRDFAGSNKRDDTWDANSRPPPRGKTDEYLVPQELSNPDFEEYYTQQDIVPEGEWEQFLQSLKTPLPITFRINGSGRYANELRDALQSDFFAKVNKDEAAAELDEVVEPPRPLPWYPNNLAWHMSCSRNQLRRLSWMADIHAYMKAANEAGSITRQEAVSMVPPLFMDVQPHHKVLDMCAAPGSKTFQLLEMLHDMDGSAIGSGTSGAAGGSSSMAQLTPTGFVVANDADAQRCNLLVHQTKRMCSPCLMVTNHEAQAFPRISAALADRPAPGSAAAAAAAAEAAVDNDGAGGSSGAERVFRATGKAGRDDMMLFDRILCDVPCSGDGTMRKAPDIWRRWNVNNGNGLHNLQLRIALQAARLLKVGGRLIYSTCTFNPIEDEAVVAELLVRCQGCLQLLDVSTQLPELKRLPGKRTWRVRDKYRWYDSWEEADKIGFKLDPTMFSDAEKQQLPLERCMRILPYQQDTGGFFIAVLEKVAPTPPLEDPRMGSRYGGFVATGSKGASIMKLEGQDPLQGAAEAAAVALQAAESAIKALEEGDAAAIAAAEGTVAAAAARTNTAMEANSKSYKLAEQYKQQEAARQNKAAAAADGADGAAPEGEQQHADDAADADADADGQNGAAEEAGGAGAAEGKEGSSKEAGAVAAAAPEGGAAFTPSWARGGGGRGREGGGRFRGIDPIYPMEDPQIIQMLVDFFGIEPGFPLSTHLIIRSLEVALPKRLYYVSDALLSLLMADEREALKITSTGLKLFERQELRGKQTSKCSYRIAQEGLPFLLPHVTKQLIRLGLDDFMRLLVEKNLPLVVSAKQAAAAAAAAADAGGAQDQGEQQQQQQQQQQQGKPGQTLLDTPAVLKQLEAVQLGGAVALLDEAVAAQLGLATLATQEASGALTANAPVAIAVWRTPASLSVLVSKTECEQLVDKLNKAIQRSKQQQQQDAVKAEPMEVVA